MAERPKRRPRPKTKYITVELPYSDDDPLIGSTVLMPFEATNPKTNEPARMYLYHGRVTSVQGNGKYVVEFIDGLKKELSQDEVKEHLVPTSRDSPFPGGMNPGNYELWLWYKEWGRALADNCIDYAMDHAEEELTFYGADAVIRGVMDAAMERYSEVAHRRGVDEADAEQSYTRHMLEPVAGYKRNEAANVPIQRMIERIQDQLAQVRTENARLRQQLSPGATSSPSPRKRGRTSEGPDAPSGSGRI